MIMTYLTSKPDAVRTTKPSDLIQVKGQVLEGEKTLAEALALSPSAKGAAAPVLRWVTVETRRSVRQRRRLQPSLARAG